MKKNIYKKGNKSKKKTHEESYNILKKKKLNFQSA